MICLLRGLTTKLAPPNVRVDVQGVGYLVHMAQPIWEVMPEGNGTIFIHTYVREDKFDLYGFLTEIDRMLFAALTAITGIGPKIALEICAIPKAELARAVNVSDVKVLAGIKGIGAKKAEKILPDLKSLCERHPELLQAGDQDASPLPDEDALAALTALGYERSIILHALKKLPKEMTRSEDRVTAVLRSL